MVLRYGRAWLDNRDQRIVAVHRQRPARRHQLSVRRPRGREVPDAGSPLAKPGLWPGSCHLGTPRLDRGNVVAWFSIVFAIMHATRVISSQAIERFAFLTRPNTRRRIGERTCPTIIDDHLAFVHKPMGFSRH